MLSQKEFRLMELEGRRRWEIEEKFINNRLTWLILTQSILFAAYSLLLEKHPTENTKSIVFVISMMGISLSLFIFIGVVGATIAMYRLKNIYKFDNYFVSFFSTIMGCSCNIGIPLTFIASWIVFFLYFLIFYIGVVL